MIKIIFASLSSSSATLAVQISSIPLLLDILGDDGFAAFQICISLSPWLMLASFGYDKALKNALILAPEIDKMKLKVQTVEFVFPRLVVLLIGVVIAGDFLSHHLFIVVKNQMNGGTFSIALIAMTLVGYLSIGKEALFAEDRGVAACWIQTVSMTTVFVILIIIYFLLPDRPTNFSVLAAIICWFLPQIVGWLLSFRLINIAPIPTRFRFTSPLSNNSGFLLASWLILISLNIDYVFLARYTSSQEIIAYTLFAKVLSAYSMFFSGFLSFAWTSWAKKSELALCYTLALIWIISFTSSFIVLVTALFTLSPLAEILGIDQFSPSIYSYLWLGMALFFRASGESFTIFYFSRGRTGTFLIVAVLQSLSTIIMQYFTLASGYGIAGVLFATAFGWFILSTILTVIAIYRFGPGQSRYVVAGLG